MGEISSTYKVSTLKRVFFASFSKKVDASAKMRARLLSLQPQFYGEFVISDLRSPLTLSEELLAFIKQSPSMFHTTQTIKEYLLENGFTYLSGVLLGMFSQAVLTLPRAMNSSIVAWKGIDESTARPKPQALMLISFPACRCSRSPTYKVKLSQSLLVRNNSLREYRGLWHA